VKSRDHVVNETSSSIVTRGVNRNDEQNRRGRLEASLNSFRPEGGGRLSRGKHLLLVAVVKSGKIYSIGDVPHFKEKEL
jgi:hypothetical protein